MRNFFEALISERKNTALKDDGEWYVNAEIYAERME